MMLRRRDNALPLAHHQFRDAHEDGSGEESWPQRNDSWDRTFAGFEDIPRSRVEFSSGERRDLFRVNGADSNVIR